MGVSGSFPCAAGAEGRGSKSACAGLDGPKGCRLWRLHVAGMEASGGRSHASAASPLPALRATLSRNLSKKGRFMTSRYKQAKTVQPELACGQHPASILRQAQDRPSSARTGIAFHPSFPRRRESKGAPSVRHLNNAPWIPAFAGMTAFLSARFRGASRQRGRCIYLSRKRAREKGWQASDIKLIAASACHTTISACFIPEIVSSQARQAIKFLWLRYAPCLILPIF